MRIPGHNGIKLGLERIEYLLEKLDNPHLKFKSIHVAGTNGKGSVCAMLSSILKEAGYKVGMYTSPHLLNYNERMKIGGRDIRSRGLEKYFKMVRPHAKKVQATEFEILTAMAFKYFADKKVDIAVVEVGMGGRFDATNVLIPEVSVITTIDYDHCEYLGNTLAKIAYEKAGIIKPGVPVVTGESKRTALQVIRRIAKQKETGCWVVGEDAGIEAGCPLLGKHQKLNASIAVKVAQFLGISKSAIRKGIRKTKWLGRFQVISKKPLVIIDGAHNPAGIRALKVTIKEQGIKTPLNLIFGVQRGKDVDAMVKEISPIAKNVIVTQSSHPRAMPKKELAKKIKQPAVIDKRLPTVICGSLFLVADVLRNYPTKKIT
ncbi:hypothetical protein A2276_04095 [candidate division WOR-1 bacterium RIFOXYA12_FULL_43_27]|uniref:tetrahydrofolate synthase n=1 Tax=candidate division WOR-1 bacterium RIFOXYC2_FULL_46_14 TaxID=1802587 RepID=A0A1F4U762_UNCSA|nr:MAG: hypothetical protein A2276_04095 [candidate division WOR-1 bacterium RIFOXYA12_FULL_43_27]OGC19129.1 MAG: hypothetical protein A2292_00240 [candidate division WOR-1 bacterium RIFOXYB2_FULL_46_45]OGC30117.1 MAG: hypothetical protein A2232_00240 [candidate division WOR-1 bacterium RIFOXYA2_FULL_46_56]OGC40719.1 MAG: hypothetical protein A2438_00245 [candidate division WOR-1 bacterium RIFOXYC2_FULL_46_14]